MPNGPHAISNDGKTAFAYLGDQYKTPERFPGFYDRVTFLCGEVRPELKEVLIFQMNWYKLIK